MTKTEKNRKDQKKSKTDIVIEIKYISLSILNMYNTVLTQTN